MISSYICLLIMLTWLLNSSQFFLRKSRYMSTIEMSNTRTISMSSLDSQLGSSSKTRSITEKMTSASIASAAVVAAAAVNAAVSMKTLSAPDTDKTFVFRDGASENRTGIVDEVGLPLIYDKELIQMYWKKQGGALTQRWTEFLGYSVPYLTKVVTLIVSGGTPALKENSATLARDARIIFEKLGPTYIKMGQMMSVRPDVLPKEALDELKILQDSVKPFDTKIAIQQIESELKCPLGTYFSEISEIPVASASLAQVYKARLVTTGEYVAIKVQRPRVLETVSKDLYVLRRAAEVYQGLVDRFLPQQRTNYVGLLSEWAVGFYTELDFLNEASNQQRLTELLISEGVNNVYIPKVYHEYCTRRVMVSEWVDGVKLSEVSPALIKKAIPDCQEAFLTQLLKIGFMHADPHPGNLLYLNEPRNNGKASVALIDFGLIASIKQSDMDTMISCIIHLANRDYPSLVDDFINLEILPADCDRAKVVPLMDKALTPYVKGGGAQKYEEELKKIYGLDGTIQGTTGGFQQMTQDALTVMNDIPFSIPPYFALLGRAIVTLEGIALTGDPSYGIIMEAYPFVARKLLSEDRPEIQKALSEFLYTSSNDIGDNVSFKTTRLSVLINSALGIVSNSNAFIDFDSLPKESVTIDTAVKLLLSPKAKSLRNLLIEEVVNGLDILTRQALRKSYSTISTRIPTVSRNPIKLFGISSPLDVLISAIPKPDEIRLPFLIPSKSFVSSSIKSLAAKKSPIQLSTTSFQPIFATPSEVLDCVAPKLSREEELYALALVDTIQQTLGDDAAIVANGDTLTDTMGATRFLLSTIANENSVFLKNVKSVLNNFVSRDNEKSKVSNEGVRELLQAFNQLDTDENKVLEEAVLTVSESFSTRLLNRLQPLSSR